MSITHPSSTMPTIRDHEGVIRVDILSAEVSRVRSSDSGQTEVIVRSRTPILTMARKLVAMGFDPARMVQAFTNDGTASLRGKLGTLAALTVQENDQGIRFVKWTPNPHAKQGEARHQTGPLASPVATASGF